MASGLLNPKNPKKSRETITHDPKQRPWATKAQVRTTAVEDQNSDDSSGQSFTGEENGLFGHSVFENRVRIALNSCSKLDIRELKSRLTSELDQVRCLVNKLEASSKTSPGAGFVGITHSQLSSNLETGIRANPAAEKKKNSTKKPKQLKSKPKLSGQLYKSCTDSLEKLMNHKFGWVFNAPVDAKALGLLDYRMIIKRPMDLGTVKTRLSKGLYGSAMEFADDVRLTFRNAILYNPKGQDVHSMAEQLSEVFEEKWAAIEARHGLEKQDHDDDRDDGAEEENRQKNDYGYENTAELGLRRPHLDGSESVTNQTVAHNSVGLAERLPGGAGSKPKVKELDKRDMTYEEKQRLSTSLQSLPSEKLDSVVRIIKKRSHGLCQRDDEIEVDIGSVDPETLWELDRFVADYNKGLSKKNKGKAELVVQSRMAEKNMARKISKTESESEGSLASGSA